MKHDKYAVYILIIVAIVGVVALASFVSNPNTLAGQATESFQEVPTYLDIAGRAVDVGDKVTVKDANNQLLTATVTEEGLVYNDILFTCTEWQSNICKTTAKFS
mgnify:CR=1 FL=1|jgi:hypothetical protein